MQRDAVLDLGGDPLAPGRYTLTVTYSNREYRGTSAADVGTLTHSEAVEVAVP